MRAGPRYVVVTPARDEAAFIGDLAVALLAQTAPFALWVVVDDGSTDGTADVVRPLAARDPRVRLLECEGPSGRRVGIGGVTATNAGLASVDDLFGYEFVANIDADLELPPEYFERLFAEFDRDPGLGIAGGECRLRTKSGLVVERVPADHVHGATKVYRSACLRDIWPLPEVWGWDAVDEHRARLRGWRTRTFDEPAFIHRKPMSGGTGRQLRGKFVCGRTAHFLGYRAGFALARAGRHLGQRPYVTGGLAMAWGFLSGRLFGAERLDEPDVVGLVRAEQAERLRAVLPFARRRKAQ